MNLLNSATTLLDKSKNIGFAFTIILIWVTVIGNTLDYVFNLQFFFQPQPSIYYVILMSVVVAPLWEELIFRHAPALLIKSFPHLCLPIMLISSYIFGIAHNNGIYSILFQGVMGFVMFWVYLKNGFSYWSSVTLHALWNSFCLIYFQ